MLGGILVKALAHSKPTVLTRLNIPAAQMPPPPPLPPFSNGQAGYSHPHANNKNAAAMKNSSINRETAFLLLARKLRFFSSFP
jgi:hypothetical protein